MLILYFYTLLLASLGGRSGEWWMSGGLGRWGVVS